MEIMLISKRHLAWSVAAGIVVFSAVVGFLVVDFPCCTTKDEVNADFAVLAICVNRYLERQSQFPGEGDMGAWLREALDENDRLDPWGQPYWIKETAGGYQIGSLGEDGVVSGDDFVESFDLRMKAKVHDEGPGAGDFGLR